jgi:hypothetical protein
MNIRVYVMQRNPLKVNSRFEGTCRLDLQDQRVGQARYQLESKCSSETPAGFEQTALRVRTLCPTEGEVGGGGVWVQRPQGEACCTIWALTRDHQNDDMREAEMDSTCRMLGDVK